MGFLVFVVIVGVIVYSVFKNAKTNQQQWRIAAERLGLGHHTADFGLTGTISGRKGGHRVVISTYSKSSGNNSKTYTKYHIDYHERIPVDFKITRQNLLHKMGHAFGLKDIIVGNPSFDELALVRGMHPQAVKDFLTPDRQAIISDLMTFHTDLAISSEMIELNKPGKEKDAGTIIRTANLLLSVCNDLTDGSAPVAQKEEPMVEIDPVEPLCNPLFSANPVVPDPPMEEVEEEPEQVEEVEAPSPENPSPTALPDVASPPVEETEEEPVPAEEVDESVVESVEPPPEAVTTYDVQAIAEDLYGEGPSTESRFEDVYLDRQVTGTGTLQRVGKFSYDSVFRDMTGVKATCELCELPGAYTKIKVKADIVFPSGRFDELKNKIGAPLAISGKLIAQNSTMHHLYILSE